MLNFSGVEILREEHPLVEEWGVVNRVVFVPENYT
jgi:hypothetical protein